MSLLSPEFCFPLQLPYPTCSLSPSLLLHHLLPAYFSTSPAAFTGVPQVLVSFHPCSNIRTVGSAHTRLHFPVSGAVSALETLGCSVPLSAPAVDITHWAGRLLLAMQHPPAAFQMFHLQLSAFFLLKGSCPCRPAGRVGGLTALGDLLAPPNIACTGSGTKQDPRHLLLCSARSGHSPVLGRKINVLRQRHKKLKEDKNPSLAKVRR